MPSPPEEHHIHSPTPHVPNSRFPVLIYRDALPAALPVASIAPLPLTDNKDTATTTSTSSSPAPAAAHDPDADPDAAASASASASASTDEARRFIERNHWYHGGTFKTFWQCHFHSVTHECYAVLRGGSRLRLGVGPGSGSGSGSGSGGQWEGHEGGDEERCEWRWWEQGKEGENGGIGREVQLKAGDVIVLPAGVSHCSISSEGGYEYLGMYPEGSPKYDNNFCKAGEEETKMKAETARKVPIPEWDPIFGHKGPLWEIWSKACHHEG